MAHAEILSHQEIALSEILPKLSETSEWNFSKFSFFRYFPTLYRQYLRSRNAYLDGKDKFLMLNHITIIYWSLSRNKI